MYDAMNSGFLFLTSTVFDLYIFILVVRLLLAWAGANYFDPFTQLVIKLTDFIIKPLRRVFPNLGRLETSSLLLIVLLDIIKLFILSWLTYGIPNLLGILVMTVGDVLKDILQIFFFAIILQAILSWIQPMSPANRLLSQITAPIMRPLHRIIPLINGIDITPIPALIILQLLIIIIANPILVFGAALAAG